MAQDPFCPSVSLVGLRLLEGGLLGRDCGARALCSPSPNRCSLALPGPDPIPSPKKLLVQCSKQAGHKSLKLAAGMLVSLGVNWVSRKGPGRADDKCQDLKCPPGEEEEGKRPRTPERRKVQGCRVRRQSMAGVLRESLRGNREQ